MAEFQLRALVAFTNIHCRQVEQVLQNRPETHIPQQKQIRGSSVFSIFPPTLVLDFSGQNGQNQAPSGALAKDVIEASPSLASHTMFEIRPMCGEFLVEDGEDGRG